MKIKYLTLLGVLLLGGFIQSCDEEENNTPKISVILKRDNNDWIKSVRGYAVTNLESYGLTYSIRYSASEKEQGSNIIDMVNRNANVLIVSPEGLPEDSLKVAHNAGIPVVFLEYPVTDTYAALVQIDNETVGKTAAEYFNNQQGISKIALISVKQDSIISKARLKGFMAGLNEESIDTVTITINNYINDDGRNAFTTIRDKHKDVDAIYAQNDEVASGILKAIGEYANIKVIVGCGGSYSYLERINNSLNITLATTLYSPKTLIETAIKEANDILNGSIPDKKVIDIETAIVDKENVATYLDNAEY